MAIDPIQVLLWTFRRSEKDVINLYDFLSQVMQLATGSSMLNFGYWDTNTHNPLQAQHELCRLVGKMAELDSVKYVIDVGSGFSAPAVEWKSVYKSLEIVCVNINFRQLKNSIMADDINLVNSTSTSLPFPRQSVDRIIALESAQHFKPLSHFIKESKRVLKQNGLLVVAIPVTVAKPLMMFAKLGILSLTWSSEHYALEYVISIIKREEFQIMEIKNIGANVYGPLTDYYIKNRKNLRETIMKKYPSYLENILFRSLMQMKKVSQDRIIDYVLIKCKLSREIQKA
ncbi:MAG: class I SAM-dependent methyltransferase [Nitrosopumilaceae archaeon]